MSLSIAHLGPPGTYAEEAALAYATWLMQTTGQEAHLCPYPSIIQTLRAIAAGATQAAVVPVENSIEGSVTVTLDTLWQLEGLQVQQALILPISHALITQAEDFKTLKTLYSHPQSLSQCQNWLEQFLPHVQLIPTHSNTEALEYVATEITAAAIASHRAAQLYQLPILASGIQDYPDNCTRFWILTQGSTAPVPELEQTHTSLAFSLPANAPGALVKPLQIFADRQINLSRIESRPSKRALGDYVFFLDLEVQQQPTTIAAALAELAAYTDVLKLLGHYRVLKV
uniref:Prephenate dehydratase n=1 Tax=Cyanothece sp. (strain PCC 7425 / ATCC 29141) TaxID=395961 RepID=B8HJX8_CYAP4